MPPEGAFLPDSSLAPDDWGEAHRIGAEVPNGSYGSADLGRNAPADRAIVELAARQHGMVTTSQLVAAGIGRRAIARRVARGWLIPRFRGVYQVGPVAARYGREMAAVLACGDGAALSHQSAAAIWGLIRGHEGDVHVTVTRDTRSRQDVRVHRSLSLNAVVHNGLPLTTPARTLKDLARHLPAAELERAEEQAHILGFVIPDGTQHPEFTRSEGERRLRALCKAARLPAPKMNARVAGYEVDAYWPSHKLVVEVDGYKYHRTRQRFESDRRKDAALQVAGYRVVRFTWRRLRYESYAVAAELAVLLRPE